MMLACVHLLAHQRACCIVCSLVTYTFAARKLPRSSKAKELDVIGDLADSKPKAKSGGCCGGGGGASGGAGSA